VADRIRGRDVYPESAGRARLTLARSLPLLLAVVGEKWVSVELLERAYDWTGDYVSRPAMADALYRLWSGLALLAIGLALVIVFRQVRAQLARRTSARGLVSGVLLFLAAFGATGGLLIVTAMLAGPLHFGVRDLPRNVLVMAACAQLVRGVAEELFYRGLVQTAFARAVEAIGIPPGRPAAILAVSFGFTLEHFSAEGTFDDMFRSSLWVFAMSCALGVMLEVSRNLWLVMATHAGINLLLGFLVPMPVSLDFVPIVPPGVAVMWLLVLLFSGIALAYRMRSRPE
jgi:membrane protease YdiL (CAAX protease family)